ncbi:heterokaryon incompatibility protein-domain-containing protein [Phaeosphaeria sp. MPI-PUGE-AT-0046c]|nr:heterokaryon incompatibility protein-domain-containing protein [Phaeosphaeria sp. MPI-PUGE-AT-0046c]
MSLYSVHPLQNLDSIRVLTLHPGETEVVEVSMGTMQLSAKPEFIALSYTWGNPTDERHPSHQKYDLVKRHLLCGTDLLAVQQNLYEALLQLRQKKEYTPIWVDAICIDQENKDELNHQLSLMSRIYCDATWVIVWLGKDDATTREATQCLSILQRDGSLVFETMSHYEAAKEFLDSIPRQSRHAIALLLRRRWFNRVWTLQEALMPIRLRCFCGPYELDITTICMFAALSLKIASSGQARSEVSKDLDELPLGQSSGGACISAWHGLTSPAGGFGARALFRYPKIDYKMEVPRTFKWLMALELYTHEARQRNCSQMQDKILAPLTFALHEAFAPESSEFLSLKREACGILDCRLPVSDLYLKFTRFMIDSMVSLDILSRAHRDTLYSGSTREPKLPSWVPPFHEVGTTSLLDDLLFTQYNAAAYLGPYHQIPRSLVDPFELPVRAVFFGRIIQISNHAAPADTTSTWLSHFRNSDSYKRKSMLGNCHDIAHVVLHNVGNRLADGIAWEAECQSRRNEFMKYHLSTVASIQLSITVSPRAMRKLFRFDVYGQRVIGLAPMQARESDHICIIQGSRVPFIVRETPGENKYKLVGEAFAEYFMRGAVESLNFADRVIVLV